MGYRYINSPTKIRQSETAECLLASLAIVTELNGNFFSLQKFRTAFPGYSSGATFGDLNNICGQLGAKMSAFEADLSSLKALQLPCILHLSNFHFVVLYKISKNWFFVADPELGAYKLNSDEVSNIWSGFVAEIDQSVANFECLEKLDFEDDPIVVAKPDLALIGKLAFLNVSILVFTIGATVSISLGIDRSDTEVGLKLVLLFCLLSAAGIGLNHVKGIILANENSHRQRQSGLELARILLEKPMKFHQNRHRSSLLTANRVFEVDASLECEKVDKIYFGALVIAGLIVFGLFLNWILGLVLLVGLLSFFSARYFGSSSLKWTTLYANTARSKQLLLFQNVVDNVLGLKFADRRYKILAELQRKSENLRAALVSNRRSILTITSAHNLIRMFEYAAITGLSMLQISKGIETTGTLFAFFILRYLLDVKYAEMMPVIDLLIGNREGLRASKSLIGSPAEFKNLPPPSPLFHEDGFKIEIIDVGFSFKPDAPILTKINLEIEKGDFVVFRGASGSGKSTLLRIFGGLLDPTEGKLKLNGELYSDSIKAWLRNNSAMLAQEEELYEGSFYDNIAYFENHVQKEEMREACKRACLHEQILKMPLKYGTMISNAGANLSGGQRQRLILARLFYQNPEIIFLDEATSQIDELTQNEILKNLVSQKKTVIFASHSESVEKFATKVIRLNQPC